MTRAEYENALLVLIAGVGKPLLAPTIEVWFTKLSDLDVRDFQRAIHAWLDSAEIAAYPAVALLRRLAGAETRPLPAIQDRGIVAWESVVFAIRRFGSRSVDFDDKAINAAIRSLGGWLQLTQTPTDELHKWTRQQFIKAYTAFASAGVAARLARPLVGESAVEFHRNGVPMPSAEEQRRVLDHYFKLTGDPRYDSSRMPELDAPDAVLQIATGLPPTKVIGTTKPVRRIPVESAVKRLAAALPEVESAR